MNGTAALKFAFLGVLIAFAFWNGGSAPARAPAYGPASAQSIERASAAIAFEAVNRTDQPHQSAPAGSPPPEIGAAVALAQDAETGEVFFEKGTRMRRPIASLTKLMTALIARERLRADDVITLRESAVRQEGIAGGFAVGERFAVSDLVAATLIVSSNDAAYALADANNANENANDANAVGQFISAMNEKARAIGMFETHFEDSTGLSPFDQSTAEDLSRFARHLFTYDRELFARTAAPKVFIRERTTGARRALVNITSFAGAPAFLGGKTGFTDEAAGNLLSLWQDNGRTYLIIVLGTEDRFGDTEKLYTWITNR